MYNLNMGTNPPKGRGKSIRKLLPSRSYLKLFLWAFALICAMLLGITLLMGQYLGYELAALGMASVFFMLVIAFAGALAAGVLLHIIDREP